MNEAFFNSLQAGYVASQSATSLQYLPKLLSNDASAGKKILTTLRHELEHCDEFIFSVAFVTTSGIATLINTLLELEKCNVKGRILVSNYLYFTQPEALKRLLLLKNVELRIAIDNNFHAKGYIFRQGDIYSIIVGSSNWTANALCTNVEWNLKISAISTSYIVASTLQEFDIEFRRAITVDASFIADYEAVYSAKVVFKKSSAPDVAHKLELKISPNDMQIEALSRLSELRKEGKNKALIVSATGTGKTFLSAFDVKAYSPKRFLFIVHRTNIAIAAMNSYSLVFGGKKSMLLFDGQKKNIDADFIFATIQTMSRADNMYCFDPEHFEYIVIDESHRAAADTYLRLVNYFKPKFMLGMTATPERTDGLDVFKLFDYNIAYEIRLQQALEHNMLSSFHYYGVTDVTVQIDGNQDIVSFSMLVSDARIRHIVEALKVYGCDDGNVRGLIFCSRNDESAAISLKLNELGYRTLALSGANSEEERSNAVKRLESDDSHQKLDYILTVDIFNEGIDIPKVNQIVMLRPTQSAIIFVQQLGRGLRKVEGKEYLTVIDFIGNYSNNYLVPIALFGDTTYNKDALRRQMFSCNDLISGPSTINFDQIAKSRIYASLDAAKMNFRRDLVQDYIKLKRKIGRIPKMMDFVHHGVRDPKLYVDIDKSLYNFIKQAEGWTDEDFDADVRTAQLLQVLLKLYSEEINNATRIEETIMLQLLLQQEVIYVDDFIEIVRSEYGYAVTPETIYSCVVHLNFEFINERSNASVGELRRLCEKQLVHFKDGCIYLDASLKGLYKHPIFVEYLNDSIAYALHEYKKHYAISKLRGGFVLYQKYSRKDVFRVLNWLKNPVAQNVGGYMLSADKSNCPIFVNYHKEEHISETSKYEDKFLSNNELQWMSKSNRNLQSNEIVYIINSVEGNMRMPLFIKKSNDEGIEFYYMGDVVPKPGAHFQTFMPNGKGGQVSVVCFTMQLVDAVEDHLFNYIVATV